MYPSRCLHVMSSGSWLTLHRRHSSDNGSVSLKRPTSLLYIRWVYTYTLQTYVDTDTVNLWNTLIERAD